MAGGGGARIWCNIAEAADAGGLLAMLERLRKHVPDIGIVLTTGRSVELPGELPEGTLRAAKPYDLPQTVDRFLAEQKPQLTILSGSDLFPSAISASRKREIPVVLVNARHRERGVIQDRLVDFRLGGRLRAFDRIFAVDSRDADFFVRKGALRERVEVLGELGESPRVPPCDEEERDYLARCVATRPVWLAAELPGSEFRAVEQAFRVANGQAHRLLLVVVPRTEQDAEAAVPFFEGAGWTTARREDGEEPDPDVQVYIADAPGETGLWYRLAPLTYLGGTLTGATFPDPFLPASLGSSILHGTVIANSTPQLDQLRSGQACRAVDDAAGLGAAVSDLLAPDRAAELAGRAWDVTSRTAEAAERSATAIARLLKETAR